MRISAHLSTFFSCLLPALKSGDASPRKIVFGEGGAHHIADIADIVDINAPEASLLYRWAVEGKWKLLLTYDGVLGRYGSVHPRQERRPQLYDVIDDPDETKTLAKEHPEIVADPAKKIADWYPLKQRKAITKWTE